MKCRIWYLEPLPHLVIARHPNASDILIHLAHNNEIVEDIVPIRTYEHADMAESMIATRLAKTMIESGGHRGVQ